MIRTLREEWAAAARTLAQHAASDAAQRHARFQAYNLPQLENLAASSPSDRRLGQVVAIMMRHMRVHQGRRCELVAAALACLAEALDTPDETAMSRELAAETIPYRPGVDP